MKAKVELRQPNVPVFPEVGSMTTLCPGMSFPSCSATSIICFAILSFTEPPAEVYSSFPTDVDSGLREDPGMRYRAWTYGDCIEVPHVSLSYRGE